LTQMFTGLPEGIPAIEELKARRQWVAWKYETRKGRLTKPPVNPNTGGYASVSDPSNWSSYETAAAFAAGNDMAGVGFVLVRDDGITGIDLDKCIDADGRVEPWAQFILDGFSETYAEVSPSGRGLRLIARGKPDKAMKFDPAGVEVYGDGRYLTITGNRHPDAPSAINPAPLTLDALAERIRETKPGAAPAATATTTNERTDFVGRANHLAMQRLADWVPDVFPAAQYHDATKGYRVASADLGRDLEEDLSITPNGIVDFGLHDMGDAREGKRTAIDLVIEYGEQKDEKAAALWLCDRLGQNPETIGYATAANEFGAIAVQEDAFPRTSASTAILTLPPPRQWLYGYMLSRKYVSILASPGGVGKTAWTFAAAISMATGTAHLHERPHKPLKVWLYNLEDDILELQRRIHAAATLYDTPKEALDRITLTSGRDRPLRIVRQHEGKTILTKDVEALTNSLIANSIDVLVLDPLVNAHAIPENDIDATAELMRVVASIADKANCAILLVHHTRKGFVSGEADSIRGGSSLVANSRGAYTLAAMSADEAKTFGVPEDRRKRFIKIDDAKANMAPSGEGGRWVHLQSVTLGNGDADYPAGDSVQVASKWSPPKALDGLSHSDIRDMLAAIEVGTDGGELFSFHNTGKNARWVGKALIDGFGRTPEQAKSFIKIAREKGWLFEEEYVSPVNRHKVKGVKVSLANLGDSEIVDLD